MENTKLNEEKQNRKDCGIIRTLILLILVLTITLFLLGSGIIWNFYRNGNDFDNLTSISELFKKPEIQKQEIISNTNSTNHLYFSELEGFIELPKFKKNDKEIVPGKYLSSTDSVDKTEFENFVLHPKESNCKDIKTLITIKSATDHFEHRMAIRESWGSLKSLRIKLLFLLGQSASTDVNEAIEKEFEDFDDIVQGSYIDSYNNLTLKALNGMEYRKKFCNEPEYILAIDDDTYVSVEDFKSHLEKFKPNSNFIECSERTVVNGKVWRQGRWAVEPSVYEAEKYPTYCNGPCYLMPKETADILYESTKNTPHDLQADDALISGILRSKSEIPLIQYSRTGGPGWCYELNNRKPHLPKRMRREFERKV